MKGDWGGLAAIVLAPAVYFLATNLRRGWVQARANHSPINVAVILSWLSVLPRRDLETETEPETDTETTGPRWRGKKLGRRHVQVDERTTKIEYVDLDKEPIPPAEPTPKRESEFHKCIRDSPENEAAYSTIVRQGKRRFGVSRATVTRAIRQVRERQASEAGAE